ncbi:hypothetical protein [Dactylosporangium sp. NPDC051541]|uniref:LppU/SCO3897 family protein n=1 Tax=Dactylosporangium sp. NPDC051541 TaxID=3363977 RepID=UPI0037AB7BF9
MPGAYPAETPQVEGEPIPTPEPPVKSKRGLVVGLLIVAAVFLVAVAGTAIVVKISNAGGTSFAVNSCVKRDGDSATGVDCGNKDAFRIVSKVDKPESCSDAAQPYIVLQHKGEKDQVLCLRPAAEK